MGNLLPEQCRAARGLLDWTQERLASLAGVSRSTVRDFESRRHALHLSTETLLIMTLEDAGICLLYPARADPGVRLRTTPRPDVGRGARRRQVGGKVWR